jgi:hypothetical protein
MYSWNATHFIQQDFAEPVWNTADYSCKPANLVFEMVTPLSACMNGALVTGPGAPAVAANINNGSALVVNTAGNAPQPQGFPAVVAWVLTTAFNAANVFTLEAQVALDIAIALGIPTWRVTVICTSNGAVGANVEEGVTSVAR